MAMVTAELLLTSTAFAAEPKPEPSRAALLGLAQQFVEKVSTGFERADDALMTPAEKRRRRYAVDIPDGEMLLLKVGVTSKRGGRRNKRPLYFAEPIIAIKQGDDVMASLSDFFNVAQFAINVKPAAGIAEGWYIRQSQKFLLDANTMTASIMMGTDKEKTLKLAKNDIVVEETDILIKSRVLNELFDLESEVILASQAINVKTNQNWPAIDKLERLRRQGREFLPPPALPRQEEPYKLVEIPNINVATTRSFSRSGEGEISRSSSHNLEAQGDLLGHTARILTSGSMDAGAKRFEELKAVFKRKSDKPDLLGWMKAHEYEFGDIGGVGVKATNRNPYMTSDPTIALEGEMTPGWDMELYNGLQYIGNIVNSDGTYRFEDVSLTPGANTFVIVQYGPLGERKEEELTVFSTPDLEGIDGGLYSVSVAATATDLWTRNPQESQDKYTPIVNGNYQWKLNNATVMKTGLSTSQKQGEQKTFTSLGVATYVGDTSLNADVKADVDVGSLQGSVAARRSLFGQNVGVGVNYVEEDFGSVSGAHVDSQYGFNASIRGRLPNLPVSYSANTNYSEDSSENINQRNRFSLSGRAGRFGISTNATQSINKNPNSESESTTGSTSLSGRLGRINWHATTDYNISPGAWVFNNYSLGMTRGLAKNLTGFLDLQNSPGSDMTSGTAGATWSAKHVRMSPKITYDTEDNLGVFLTSTFGLSYDSHGNNLLNDIIMRGEDPSNFGGVSAFVYLDHDGDFTFSEGDEPIQDAIVEAVHARSTATTNEHGKAFIYDIPANTVTDVKLNEFSFFDPYLISGFEGVSILPRAGHEAYVEFPVHNGGEMDGIIFAQPKRGKPRSLRNVHVMLYDMDGRLAQSAISSFDGFYLFQKIRPGRYYLIIDEKDAENFGFLRPLPEEIEFGYDGTIIYGHNIVLEKTSKEGPHDTPLNIGADYSDFININPSFNPDTVAGRAVVLNLGSYNSNLLMSLVWYKLKARYNMILGDATLLVEPKNSYASIETGLHTLRVRIDGYDMDNARQRCRALMARDLYCGVEIMPQINTHEEAGVNAHKG